MISFIYDEERTRKENEEYHRELAYASGHTEGMIAGKREGMIEGKIESHKEFILDLLSFKGNITEKLKIYICSQSDFDTLKRWYREANFCASIPDLCKTIGFAE